MITKNLAQFLVMLGMADMLIAVFESSVKCCQSHGPCCKEHLIDPLACLLSDAGYDIFQEDEND